MAQWLKVLAALAEVPVQFPVPMLEGSQPSVNSSSIGLDALFWPSQALANTLHTQTHIHTHRCKLNKNIKFASNSLPKNLQTTSEMHTKHLSLHVTTKLTG